MNEMAAAVEMHLLIAPSERGEIQDILVICTTTCHAMETPFPTAHLKASKVTQILHFAMHYEFHLLEAR